MRSIHYFDDNNFLKQALVSGDNSDDIPNPMLEHGGGDSSGKSS